MKALRLPSSIFHFYMDEDKELNILKIGKNKIKGDGLMLAGSVFVTTSNFGRFETVAIPMDFVQGDELGLSPPL